MGGGAPVVPAAGPGQQGPDGPDGKGLGQPGHILRREGEGPIRLLLKPPQGLLRLGGEAVLVLPQPLGGVGEPGQKPGIEGLQLREHPVAEPVPGVDVLPVGGVLPPGEPPEAKVVLDLPPGGGEQGTDQIPVFGGHAAQPPQAGPPGQMEQQRLGVVAGGVGHGDVLGAGVLGGFPEKGVAQFPGGLLQATAGLLGPGRHIAGAGEQLHRRQRLHGSVRAERPLPAAAQGDKLPDKLHVLGGLRPPEPVVEVGGGQGEIQLPAQPPEPVEQIDGIRAAGDGAQHGASRRDQTVFPNQLDHGIGHNSS